MLQVLLERTSLDISRLKSVDKVILVPLLLHDLEAEENWKAVVEHGQGVADPLNVRNKIPGLPASLMVLSTRR